MTVMCLTLSSCTKTVIQGKEQYIRGHSLKLFIEREMLEKESCSFRVTRLWNDLPEVVVTAPSVNSFKNRLDRHWSTIGSRRAFQRKVEDLTIEATA